MLTYFLFPDTGPAVTLTTGARGTHQLTINPTTSQVKTTYTWTVVDADDNTDPSDRDTLSFTVQISPEKAPTPTVSAGDTQVRVSWAKPADAGISGWQLKRDSGGEWTAISPTGTETLSQTGDRSDQRHGIQLPDPRRHRQRRQRGWRRGIGQRQCDADLLPEHEHLV